LIDLALIAEVSTLDAKGLRGEIDSIFRLRGTHKAPDALPPAPREWATPYRRLAEEVGISPELAMGHQEAAALLDPILSREVRAGKWDRKQRKWF